MDLRNHQWILIAKQDGICNETGRPIKEGDKIMYIPAKPRKHLRAQRIYHLTT